MLTKYSYEILVSDDGLVSAYRQVSYQLVDALDEDDLMTSGDVEEVAGWLSRKISADVINGFRRMTL